MDITLRNAILISFAVHVLVIVPGYSNFLLNDLVRNKDRIMVDYVMLEEPKAADERQRPEPKTAETPKIEMRPRVEVQEQPAAAAAKKEAAAAESREVARKQAQIKSTKDYVNYYQLLRERIRERLKSHYGRQHGEGEVRLEFVLRADGALAAASVDRSASVRDAALIDIAIRSLKEASPFPPFPKAVDLPQMSFDLTVVFKKE
jgi:TonB family protein